MQTVTASTRVPLGTSGKEFRKLLDNRTVIHPSLQWILGHTVDIYQQPQVHLYVSFNTRLE